MRRAGAEAVGTGFLVAAVVGSGVMAERLTGDPALMLLCNTLATGAMLVVLITALGPISGAHFNPAVTLVCALERRIRGRDAVLYIVAQIAGGIAGTIMAHLMFAMQPLQVGTIARAEPSLWLSEAVAAFGLVAVVLLDARFNRPALPWLVGLYIVAAYWFTASTSFANPAVTIARALTDSFSGIRPMDVPAFVGAQLVGALTAFVVVRGLAPPVEPAAPGRS